MYIVLYIFISHINKTNKSLDYLANGLISTPFDTVNEHFILFLMLEQFLKLLYENNGPQWLSTKGLRLCNWNDTAIC